MIKKKDFSKDQKILKNQKSNNDNDKSELSSIRSESSTKTLSSDDDKLEREVYYPDVANILGSKNETQTSFEYLVNNTQEFFRN